MVVSREVGEQGTPHLQGAITFRMSRRFASIKKLLPRAHWGRAKCIDPFTYCLKDGSVVEINHDTRAQGKRTDLDEVGAFVKEAKRTKREIAEAFPSAVMKYSKGIETYMQWMTKPRVFTDEPPEVYWRWGATGLGKTWKVFEKEKDLWQSSENLKWFDGYIGQEAVLLDELRKDSCSYGWLLRLTDRYPLQVPVKGGFAEWVPKRIYITSDRKPQEIWPEEGFRIDQLVRRIKEIQHITSLDNNTC